MIAANPCSVPNANRRNKREQGRAVAPARLAGHPEYKTPGLTDIAERAVCAPACPARRAFAILLVDAMAVPDVLSARSSQARLDRTILALLESALPDVLLRSGYPFAGDLDAKRRSLAKLSTSIDERPRLREPSIPHG